MANPEHLAILKEGAERWNAWRNERPDLIPDLAGIEMPGAHLMVVRPEEPSRNWGIDLHGTILRSANLRHANLGVANLAGANLTDANLVEADLRQANLTRAALGGASLSRAYLIGANLNEAELRGADLLAANLMNAYLRGALLEESNLMFANLNGARLTGADLSKAWVGGTVFTDIDLSEVVGLDTLRHNEASSIGIDTVYMSHGNVNEVFLRGCGVPEEFIAYIGSMVGRPIEYYSCFISYSTKDQAFADRLYADLQAKGVRCWFAPHDIMGGRKIHEQIDEAIRVHDKLLLILSEHSMASDWVGLETGKALKREKAEGKRVLFPVRLVEFKTLEKWEKIVSSGVDVAEEIRQYYIPDFSGWERDATGYQREFEKLVRALKAGSNP